MRDGSTTVSQKPHTLFRKLSSSDSSASPGMFSLWDHEHRTVAQRFFLFYFF